MRGKFNSAVCPVLIGAVRGSLRKTPVLLTLQLRPLKNLLASGSHTLTGQASVLRLSLRCSDNASIINISIKHDVPSTTVLIGHVKMGRLVHLGEISCFHKKALSAAARAESGLFLSGMVAELSGSSRWDTSLSAANKPNLQSYGIPVTYGSPPAMYMIEHFEGSTNTNVRLHAITDPLGTPQRVTYDLTVPAYSPPEDPPQKGTGVRPETFDSRFWSCVWRDGSLWATHHQGSSRVMARWYEIKTNDWPSKGTPELYQSGDIDPGENIRTFFTAIAPDGYGNAAMCFARSSPDEYISVARCMRLADDPLGTMGPVVIVKESEGPYNSGR